MGLESTYPHASQHQLSCACFHIHIGKHIGSLSLKSHTPASSVPLQHPLVQWADGRAQEGGGSGWGHMVTVVWSVGKDVKHRGDMTEELVITILMPL